MDKLSYNNLELFTPDSRPFGRTYADWTASWWQWVLSIPKIDNPLLDQNGKNCANNQSGPVWFLAGTLQGQAERSCTIPEELTARVRYEMDEITNIRAMVSGTNVNELRQYRIQSPPFNVTLPTDNVLGLPAQTTKMMSEGYWLFLKPLEPGNYDLYSFGSCLAGRIKIGISYHLTVEK
jgi:hypothetical protein